MGLVERLGWTAVLEHLEQKRVPSGRFQLFFFGGGLSLALWGVLVLTGAMLMVYYIPGEQAHASVRNLVIDVDYGWLVRALHVWSARFLVLAVLVHMAMKLAIRAYRSPREITWWSGVAFLAICFAMALSGHVLVMDQRGFFAARIGLDMLASVPVLGALLVDLIRAGPDVGPAMAHRLYVAHVALLPLLALMVGLLHLIQVQLHERAPLRPSLDAARRIHFAPDFLQVELLIWFGVALLVVAGAVWLPPALGPAADPLEPVSEGLHPAWEFWAPYQLMELVGKVVSGAWGMALSLALMGAAVVGFLALPFSTGRWSAPVHWWCVAAFAGYVVLTLWGVLQTAFG